MAIVTFSEAARLCGHKSRSTLYRLRDGGDLAGYLRPPVRPGGPPLLNTHPSGILALPDHVRAITRLQINSPALRAEDVARRRTELAHRRAWEVTAAALSDALAAAGVGLQLTGAEAAAIAAALPAALSEGQGGGVIAPPSRPADRLQSADGSAPFWSEYGRIAGTDEPPLTPAEYWEHAYRITCGMLGWEPCSAVDFPELVEQINEACADVAAGARWDESRWYRASVLLLLGDLPCPLSEAELGSMLTAGTVPPDLVPIVRRATAAAC